MHLDFTLKAYRSLLEVLFNKGYYFQTMEAFANNPSPKTVVLRHDVDSWPENALQMAKIEAKKGIKASYYFRIVPASYREGVLKKIADLGHEIGYHYEDLSDAQGDLEKAYNSFQLNLEKIRAFYPVKTITMHGRPLSRWNNQALWETYNYKALGLVCEPYLDVDYNKVLYLTDTGGCWNGHRYSVRDHVKTGFQYNIKTTFDLIEHISLGKLPDQMILNIHPARWNENFLKWFFKLYLLTYPKRQIKAFLKKYRQ